MNLRRLIILAACAFAVPVTTFAGTVYTCDMNTKIKNGWVAPKIRIVLDDTSQVSVNDRIIQNVLGGPVKGQVARNGDRLRVTWNIANAKDSKGQRIPTFRYVATLNTKSRAISVIAKPVLTPQRWSAKGTCKQHSN